MSGRRRKVVINGYGSDWKKVESGVPQGSVLGPVGFVVNANDIDECATDITTIKKFGDDTKVANKIKEEQDHVNLQNCLNKMLKCRLRFGTWSTM